MHLTATSPRAALTSARQCALPLLFGWFGMLIGSWASRIPGVRAHLHIEHATLSAVLLCGGLGAVIAAPISARMMARGGARDTVLYAGLALFAALLAIGAAPNVPLLMLAVLTLGVAASCFDVGVNSAASAFERRRGSSELSKLHAWFCAGSLAGALLGGLLAGMHVSPLRHFLLLAPPLGALLWFGCSWLERDEAEPAVERKHFSLPRGPFALLGALGFFGAMSEGGIADWSGVFLKDHFRVSDGVAPLALSGFSVAMLAMRLCGDRLKDRHGARRLIGVSALASAGGLFWAVLAPHPYLALLGFALAGAGLAPVFPLVFSAAGRAGPAALSGVATLAYSGSLLGPPVVGALAHGFGMQAAIGFIGALSLLIAVAAKKSMLLD